MIIDLILDRYDLIHNRHIDNYNAHKFYIETLEYENIFELGNDITLALDYGTDENVREALCKYIDGNGYNPNIKDFINSVKWINDVHEHTTTIEI